jgi:asparagine synthase (glutamine-hydrolysing)
MCGYVGFFNCGNRIGLQNSISEIAHRGPDDEGIEWFSETNTGLAHQRLSIIDLSPLGHQPMQDSSGLLWIIFNGEIYNYIEIKKELAQAGISFKSNSDTEVILEAYKLWGIDCLQKLNGMFSFVIYNKLNDEVFAVRDRLGIKPLYYTQVKGGLIVASEIKSILASGIYEKQPDYSSLHTPVHYQVAPYTGFRDVLKLKPGYYLTFKKGVLETHQYWSISANQCNISFDEAFEKLDYLLQDSVRLQMIADVPVGILLSGGLDSSIIAALMKRQTSQDIHSFTIKFKSEDLKKQGNVDDSYYAQKIAGQLNLKHHEILIEPDIVNLLPKIVWHLDEPLADPASINTYLICKSARDLGIIVLLNGMGADEVFSGYRAHLACLKADSFQKYTPEIIQSLLVKLIKYLPEATNGRNLKYFRWIKSFLSVAALPQFERSILVKNSALGDTNFNKFFANPPITYENSFYYKREKQLFNLYNTDYLTQMCLNDTMIYMPDHNLTYTDKASMAASVECRPPLIDHRIIEHMFSLPPHFRINKNIQKNILKKVAEKYLPNEIIYRPKAPFSAPMRGWIKKELDEMVQDIISEESVKRRGIYNPKYVRSLIDNNRKGLEDNSQIIFRLLCSELWFKTFFNIS